MRAVVGVLAFALPAWSGAAFANDTTAQLGTGGLVFVRNEHVALKTEDLFVSPERISVAYRFHNASDRDQRVLVAFPLPDITGDPYSIIGLPDGPADNIFNFRTTFDGKPVAATLHQYAFVNNIDYSAELEKLGIPLAPFGDAAQKALLALPEPDKERLAGLGLVSRDEYRAGNGAETDMLPVWTLRSAYSWEATFPAGKDAKVVHAYQPSVGGTVAATFVSAESGPMPEGVRENFGLYRKKYCVDDALVATLRKRIVTQDGYRFVPYAEQWISYIWSTGANWAGPVEKFTLTVDKGDPASLVSFCGEGVKKTGPTTFQLTVNGWMPDGGRELEILILNRIGDPQ